MFRLRITGEWYSPVAEVDKSYTLVLKKELPDVPVLNRTCMKSVCRIESAGLCESFVAGGGKHG